MTRRTKIFVLFISFVFLFSCGKAEKAQHAPSQGKATPAAPQRQEHQTDGDKTTHQASQPDMVKRKIIKEGEVLFETADMDATRLHIDKAVKETKSYISEDTRRQYDDRTENRIVIRVPSDDFDTLITMITAKTPFVEKKNIRARDVTEEYVDIEARLRTKKELEKRYHQLLNQARTVEDILKIEKQIGEVREQIETSQGRINYLNNRIAYSTLTVVYYQVNITSGGLGAKFVKGIQNGWRYFIMFFVGMANIWPFLLVPVIAGIVIVVVKRRKKSR